jgi:endonuclease-8
MPEGDTIFKAARALARVLTGEHVLAFHAVAAELSRRELVGSQVSQVQPLGKHLLIHFDARLVLWTHLGMHGAWRIFTRGEAWPRSSPHAACTIETALYEAVCFRPSTAKLLTERELLLEPRLTQLGPDLLAPNPDLAAAEERLRALPDHTIADALLNQRALAGLGNVFKSEVLFSCAINPFRPVRELSDEDLRRVVAAAQKLLARNTLSGRRVTTSRATLGSAAWVYGRTGEPCLRCGARVMSSMAGAARRRTYFCPVCQGVPLAPTQR